MYTFEAMKLLEIYSMSLKNERVKLTFLTSICLGLACHPFVAIVESLEKETREFGVEITLRGKS